MCRILLNVCLFVCVRACACACARARAYARYNNLNTSHTVSSGSLYNGVHIIIVSS